MPLSTQEDRDRGQWSENNSFKVGGGAGEREEGPEPKALWWAGRYCKPYSQWGHGDWQGGPKTQTSEPELSLPHAQPQPAMGKQWGGAGLLPGPGLHSPEELPDLELV